MSPARRTRLLVVLLSVANVAIFWLVQATRLEFARGVGNAVLVFLVESAIAVAALDGTRNPWRTVATMALVVPISAALIFVSILVALTIGCANSCV